MTITDVDKACRCLERIGYYRLSAYWYPFRKLRPQSVGSYGFRFDEFGGDIDFPTVLDLYVFDKKLRLIVLDALERIEIAVRTSIALQIGVNDSRAHLKRGMMHGNFARRNKRGKNHTEHDEWIGKYNERIRRSSEDFVKHFKEKYSNDNLPIWMSVELWDFGLMSWFFSGMKVYDKDQIAMKYKIPNGEILQTWLRCLNDVRNICAHHSRLWSRALVNQPKWFALGEASELDHVSGKRNRIYTALAMIQYMLRTINPSSEWSMRLIGHIETFPNNDKLSLYSSSGFPVDWMDLELWQANND